MSHEQQLISGHRKFSDCGALSCWSQDSQGHEFRDMNSTLVKPQAPTPPLTTRGLVFACLRGQNNWLKTLYSYPFQLSPV